LEQSGEGYDQATFFDGLRMTVEIPAGVHAVLPGNGNAVQPDSGNTARRKKRPGHWNVPRTVTGN
jgi:hypothetical protein